jgi:6-pyruvoyltetrahydropterin/6-carboxytetrahydropterin synthase
VQAELVKTFRFDAAHSLPELPEGHKCRRLHGHGYRVDVHVTGDVDAAAGMVMDFGEINRVVSPVLEALDHRCLNDVAGLDHATSEMIAKYVWDRVRPSLPSLSAVVVWESETARCVYRGG